MSIILKRFALMAMALVCLAPTAGHADGPDAEHRYVARQGVRLYTQAATGSRIIYDLPPGVLLYGAPAGPGWVKVARFGTLQHRVNEHDDPITLRPDGLLNVNQSENDEFVYKAGGFAEEGALEAIDEADDFPADVLKDVPQPWISLGVKDDRRWVTQKSVHPFDAIVTIEEPVGAGRIAECTGFVVGDSLTVATAGHCLVPNAPITVIFRNGPAQSERIEATVKASADEDNGDWAVLTLARQPKTPVTPLHVEKGPGLAGQRRVRVLVVGYPGDLDELASSILGYVAPAEMGCDLDTGQLVKDGAESADFRTFVAQDCQAAPGFSGSPWLVWDSAEARWDVLAIHSGRADDAGPRGLKRRDFDPATLSALQAMAYERMRQADPGRLQYADKTEMFFDFEQNALVPSLGALEGALLASRNRLARKGNLSARFTQLADPSGALSRLTPTLDKDLERSWAYVASLDHGDDLAVQRIDAGFLANDLAARQSAERQREALLSDRDQASLNLAGDVDNGPSRSLWIALRWLCVDTCIPKALELDNQGDFTFGKQMTHAAIDAAKGHYEYWTFAQLPQAVRQEMALLFDDPTGMLLYVGAGDAYIIDKNRMPVFIVRDVMRLGGDAPFIAGPFAASATNCSTPETPDDLPTLWSADRIQLQRDYNTLTPAAITGAKTVSARQAHCLIHSHPDTIVLSGLSNSLGLPGANGVSWAAIASMDPKDGIASKLSAFLLARPGVTYATPLLVYCHNIRCAMSENVVRRLVAEGFTNVSWMRSGLQGWLEDGYELSVARDTPMTLTPADITPFPPEPAIAAQSGPDIETVVPGMQVAFPGTVGAHAFRGYLQDGRRVIRPLWIYSEGKLTFSVDVLDRALVTRVGDQETIFGDQMQVSRKGSLHGWPVYEGVSLPASGLMNLTREMIYVVGDKMVTLSVHINNEADGDGLASEKAAAFLNQRPYEP